MTLPQGDHFTENRVIRVGEDGVHVGEFHGRKVWDRGGDGSWKHFKDRVQPYYDKGVVGFTIGSQFLEFIPVGYIPGVGWRDITPVLWTQMSAQPILEREEHYIKFGARMQTLPGMTGFGWRKQGTFDLIPVYRRMPALNPTGNGSYVDNVLVGFKLENFLFFDISDLYESGRIYRLNGGRLEIQVAPNAQEVIDPTQSFYTSAQNRDGYIENAELIPGIWSKQAYPAGTSGLLGFRDTPVHSYNHFYPGSFDTSSLGASAEISYIRLVVYCSSTVGVTGNAYVLYEGDRIGAVLSTDDWQFAPNGCGSFPFTSTGWKWMVFSAPYSNKVNLTGMSDYELIADWTNTGWNDFVTIRTSESSNDPYLRVIWTSGSSRVQSNEGVVGSVNPVNTGGNVP